MQNIPEPAPPQAVPSGTAVYTQEPEPAVLQLAVVHGPPPVQLDTTQLGVQVPLLQVPGVTPSLVVHDVPVSGTAVQPLSEVHAAVMHGSVGAGHVAEHA